MVVRCASWQTYGGIPSMPLSVSGAKAGMAHMFPP